MESWATDVCLQHLLIIVDTYCLECLNHFKRISDHESKATCQQQVLLHVYELVEYYPKCRELVKHLNMEDSRWFKGEIVLLPLWRSAFSMWVVLVWPFLLASISIRFVRLNKILAPRPCHSFLWNLSSLLWPRNWTIQHTFLGKHRLKPCKNSTSQCPATFL